MVEAAVFIAAVLGARIDALSCKMHMQKPGHFLPGSFTNIPAILAGERAKNRKNAQELIAAFNEAAERVGVAHETILQKCSSGKFPKLPVAYALLRELTIIPVPDAHGQMYTEVRNLFHDH